MWVAEQRLDADSVTVAMTQLRGGLGGSVRLANNNQGLTEEL
jgi:hypothetical protein